MIILFLFLLLSLALPAPAQMLVNEIYTASQDAAEFGNFGAAPVTLAGWRVEYGGFNPSLIWTAGVFNFPTGTVVAPGELIVLRESTAGPVVAPGTQIFTTSININWATTGGGQTRGGACILVNSSNLGVDMVRWLSAVPPNQFGASFTGTYNPNQTQFSRQDFTDNDDASDWADEPLNLGSLSGGQQALQNVLQVSATTTGAGDLIWTVVTASPPIPNGEIYNFVSLQDFTPDGSGPFFGIGFDAVLEVATPASPGNIFHTFLDPSGQWGLNISGGLPAGLHVETVSVLLSAGGVDRISNVVALTF